MSFQDQENTQQSTDQLTFSVGERSFNAESAATKIEAADNHIKTIEQENQEYKDRLAALEAQVAQSTKIDDALAKLQQQQSQESQATDVTPSVSEEQIGAIATKQMEEYLAQQRAAEQQKAAETLAETTFRETSKVLEQQYGDKVNEAVQAKAAELGCTMADMDRLAKDPIQSKLLLESMKASTPVNQATPSGSFNTAGIPHAAPERHMDYSKRITSSTILDALDRAGAKYN